MSTTVNIDHLILQKVEILLSTLTQLTNDIVALKQEIESLKVDLKDVRAQVNEIHQHALVHTSSLENIQKSAVKLDEHIDKIDGIYDAVKDPFHKAMNIISWDPANLIGY